MPVEIKNPFRPGAGHMPPYLAGREQQILEFSKLLDQDVILKNSVVTGLRGVGKTVLLETLKPLAISKGWLWCGSDASESASVNEELMARKILIDLAPLTSEIVLSEEKIAGFHFQDAYKKHYLTHELLLRLFDELPGLTSDKLREVLEYIWQQIKDTNNNGIIFAYDEAQTLADHEKKEQFPLSVILDVFQSIQRKGIRFMLVLAGLPTLVSKLVEARTYTERMFDITTLAKLPEDESKKAILEPLKKNHCPFAFPVTAVNQIVKESGGYPHFIQFMSKETFDVFSQRHIQGVSVGQAPINEIIAKLDKDFFSVRWTKMTDRQKALLKVIASLEASEDEFTIQDIVAASKSLKKSFSGSHVNQMLNSLTKDGLTYKNKHGKYCFAVPLLAQFIRRQTEYATSSSVQLPLFVQ